MLPQKGQRIEDLVSIRTEIEAMHGHDVVALDGVWITMLDGSNLFAFDDGWTWRQCD